MLSLFPINPYTKGHFLYLSLSKFTPKFMAQLKASLYRSRLILSGNKGSSV